MRPALTSNSPTGWRGPAAVSRMSSSLTHCAQMCSTRRRCSAVNSMVAMRSLTRACDEQANGLVRDVSCVELATGGFLGDETGVAKPTAGTVGHLHVRTLQSTIRTMAPFMRKRLSFHVFQIAPGPKH